MKNAVSKDSPLATWTSTEAYLVAMLSLVGGLACGYFVRGSWPGTQPSTAAVQSHDTVAPRTASTVSLPPVERPKDNTDTRIEPLLLQLQSAPNDPVLLAKLGDAHFEAQQFREALRYYERAEKVRPGNTNVLTDMGSAYFHLGNVDKALQLYNEALRFDPAFPNAWFNIGMVEWQSRQNASAAIAAWENLLKRNPNHPRRAEVEQLIVHAKLRQGVDKPAEPR